VSLGIKVWTFILPQERGNERCSKKQIFIGLFIGVEQVDVLTSVYRWKETLPILTLGWLLLSLKKARSLPATHSFAMTANWIAVLHLS
jgi:hypothetical protein